MDPSLSWLYFPSAVLLGALHALEPGHAKTLTAAYLIGTKGTKRDAVLLGISVAFTHSIIVVGLATTALWVGQETFTDRATRWLQMGSGIVVILLGVWLLWRRWPRVRRSLGHDHPHHHHHAPEPFVFRGRLAQGALRIVDTPGGERMRLALQAPVSGLTCRVDIFRPDGEVEVLPLRLEPGRDAPYTSDVAPREPHEFVAVLEIVHGDLKETLPFEMHEPADHHHDHDLMDEDEHARAHAATLPDYAKRGERPGIGQILAFGAAGGLVPCPASVTVMLLALSVGKVGMGLFTVLGFSLGLALALVGVGLIVVAGISHLGSTGRFAWLSRRAPVISAVVVMLSGLVALLIAH